MAHAETGSRRLIHLAEDHDRVIEHPRVFHLAIQLLALTGALADTAENGGALVLAHHVVDHLGDEHRLAHAGSAKQAGLAAALQRSHDVNRFDAGGEYLGLGDLLVERHRVLVNGAPLATGDLLQAVDGFAEDIEHPPEEALADRDEDRCPRVDHRRPTGEALRGIEGDCLY
ncbi:MAG: hypothetical protein BWY79_02084 [Actinobacteria bacterium ADurb.Bin444]|nr:MAG: hypothetical protein BWY79_02084 [Actinobacteria bacterium ADurb.Bin444]